MSTRWDLFLERNSRVWMGASLRSWLGTLRRHGVRFSWRRAHLAAIVCVTSPFNSLAGWLGDRIFLRDAQPEPTPIFILGHWRSGTTLLHQILALDPRFAFPTTWECLAPHASLWMREENVRFLPLRIPSSRPFDRVKIDWQSPQEDEFALSGMGVPSPYEWFGFPRSFAANRRPERFWELARGTPVAATLRRFIARMVSRRARGLCSSQATSPSFVLLKSPTHTFRLAELRREFPTARFVHIHRDPYLVFSSSRRLWVKLTDHQGLQRVDFAQAPERAALDEHILRTYEEMHTTLRTDLDAWQADGDGFEDRYVELDYEEIDPTRANSVESIVALLTSIYVTLGLSSPSNPLPASMEQTWRTFLTEQSKYEKNSFPPLDDEERKRIDSRWHRFHADTRLSTLAVS